MNTSPGTTGSSVAAVGDLADLYRALAKPLERIVRVDIKAPDPVIEDACQFAWSRLVHHQDRVQHETALGWLVKTAVHEAVKLIRRADRDVSLDAVVEQGLDFACAPRPLAPHNRCEQRERLAALRSLPRRQQRLLWLYGLGLSYAEIASESGCTTRTVERQLQRARATLRMGDAG